jgi:flagellar biosynthesis component FlhA
LSNLLKEGIPIRDLETILETLGDHANVLKDMDIVTEYVRQSLKRTITHRFAEANSLRVITLDTQIEDMAFRYGDASASVSGYGNTVNVEAVKACADVVSDITAKVCAAIVSHGGTTVSSAVSSLVAKYIRAGGDPAKATVECKDGSCTITDGCTTCTDAGCYTCEE